MCGLDIAVLCSGYGWVPRGAETFLHDLMQRLHGIDSSYHFDVYTRGPGGAEENYIRVRHVPAVSRYSRWSKLYAQVGHRLRFYLRPAANFEYLTFSMMLVPQIMARRYDCIFNHLGPFPGLVCQFVRRTRGTPFIRKCGSMYNGHIEVIEARQNPDAFVCTSPVGAEWIKERFPALNVRVIPEAVDTWVFRPEAGRAETGLPSPLVLFVGGMDAHKRPWLTIEAVSRLKEVSLLMIGDGPLREQTERLGLSKLGPGRFKLISWVKHSSMPLYYNACDLFTLPSEEPSGIAFLEAMACNKPVVANISPVQEWMFQDGGVLCDCTDPAQYAATLARVLETRFGEAPRERSRYFDWKRVAKAYDSVFRDVGSQKAALKQTGSENTVSGWLY